MLVNPIDYNNFLFSGDQKLKLNEDKKVSFQREGNNCDEDEEGNINNPEKYIAIMNHE